MDDFLPKPFIRAQLLQGLRRWLPVAVGAEVVALRTPTTAVRRLDSGRLEDLQASMGDDFTELIDVFLQSATELVDGLRDAAGSGDARAVFRAAHTLKSSASNVGAIELSRLARRLEVAAKVGLAPDASNRIDAIDTELQLVRPLLTQAVRTPPKGARNAVS